MPDSSATLGLVVPTRNRPVAIRDLLQQLADQRRLPDRVVVVDGSDEGRTCESIVDEFAGVLPVIHLRHWPPSAAAQRNAGADELGLTVDLIGLFDDDIAFGPETLQDALGEIASLFHRYIGFGLGRSEPTGRDPMRFLKASRLAQWLGLYTPGVGRVARSGWHSRMRPVAEPTEVDWLHTGAVIWRADTLSRIRFDEFFERYSYLEDLDFSLRARQFGPLCLLHRPVFEHPHTSEGRGSSNAFGKIELRNRYYIVCKHRMSKWRFWIGIGIRMAMTLAAASTGRRERWQRLRGNLAGLIGLGAVRRAAETAKAVGGRHGQTG